jgi:hypothetical protein
VREGWIYVVRVVLATSMKFGNHTKSNNPKKCNSHVALNVVTVFIRAIPTRQKQSEYQETKKVIGNSVFRNTD